MTRVLRRVTATRYVAPLREGGSLPGLVEADDLGTYVVKFRGAGQGVKALAAEVIAGELARRLGLPVPDLVLIDLDPAIGRREPDEEVQHLLAASSGENLAVDFLPGSVGYDGLAWRPDLDLAARVLWFDALVANVDRSWRNPNLLVWHRRLWCIDHGATLVFHHAWTSPAAFAARPYPASDHVLRPLVARRRAALAEAAAALGPQVSAATLAEVLDLVPEGWLVDTTYPSAGQARSAYAAFLTARVAAVDDWLPGVAR